MTITVSATDFDAGLTISAGNPLVVMSGGLVDFITVLSGASATVSAGGSGDGFTVYKGGLLEGTGQLAGDSLVYGTVSGPTLGLGGYLALLSGGVASRLAVSGSSEFNSQFMVNSGGRAVDTVVDTHGEEVVYAGGVASGDVVDSGGVLFIAGGTVADEKVESGGDVDYGGAISANVSLVSGAQGSTTVLGGVEVASGGVASLVGAKVLDGATVSLGVNEAAFDLTVSKGGTLVGPGGVIDENVDFGVIRGAIVQVGYIVVSSGGTLSSVGPSNGGVIKVDADGVAKGTLVSSGGVVYVYTGGATSGDSVLSAGKELISSGGVARTVHVNSGGADYVYSSGVTAGTVVSSGGYELVSAGGVADEATVLKGGGEYVYSGGAGESTVVSSGGKAVVSSGGAVLGLTLISGGELIDEGEIRFGGAGTLAGTLSGSGSLVQTKSGDLLLSGAGAGFDGKAVISGGTIELGTSGALGTGSVTFVAPATGSAVLQIDAGDAPKADGTFANVISNFNSAGEDIDLRSIAFVSGATAKVEGSTLVLTDGGKTYTFKIAGTTASAYPVLSDGHGGTLIDPRAVAFTQTAAAFAPSDAGRMALVSNSSPNGLTPLAYWIGSGGVVHP